MKILIYFGLFVLIISSSFILLFSGDNKSICDLDSKYFPGKVNIYNGEHHDFLKAIWENGTVQDYHIVVDDCKVEKFDPSSKKFNMSYDYYVGIKNKFGHFN